MQRVLGLLTLVTCSCLVAGCGGASLQTGPARAASATHSTVSGGHATVRLSRLTRGIGDVGSAGGVTWAINGHGIWLTTNGGRAWRRSVPRHIAAAKIAVASPPDIQFVNKRVGWMSAPLAFDRQELSKGHHHWEFDWTTNGGRTWHDATPPSCRIVCYDGSLSFLDARHGYLFAAVRGAHAPNKLFRTSDGGRTWQLVSQPSIWGPITFVNKHVAFAGGPGQMVIGDLTPGPPIITLYRTTDGGRTWSKYNIAGSKSFVELPIHVVGPHVALVQNGPNHDGGLSLNPGTIDVSPNGGHDWVRQAVPGTSGRPASFSAVSPSVWAYSSGSNLFTTHDAGRHWRKIVFRSGARNSQVMRFSGLSKVVFTSRRVGWGLYYGFHADRTLIRTTDGGKHWKAAGPPLPQR
jgi:photosystem II stability/assembly factor-like uncharacterized protein